MFQEQLIEDISIYIPLSLSPSLSPTLPPSYSLPKHGRCQLLRVHLLLVKFLEQNKIKVIEHEARQENTPLYSVLEMVWHWG